MLKLMKEINIGEFEAWSGGKDTLNKIEDYGKLNELQDLIESINEYWGKTELNDFLWFEEDYIYECLGMEVEED